MGLRFRPLVLAATILLVVGIGFPRISTASTVYTLTADGSSGGLGTGPWGTITVDQSGLDLLFDVEVSPNAVLNRGTSHHSLTFRLSNTSGTVADIVGGVGTGTYSQVAGTSFVNGPFKYFNYAIDCSITSGDPFTATNNCGSSLTFKVQNAGAILASTNDPNIYFAADIASKENGNTGVVGATISAVPLPAGLVLFLGGLGGLGLMGRMRSKRRTLAVA